MPCLASQSPKKKKIFHMCPRSRTLLSRVWNLAVEKKINETVVNLTLIKIRTFVNPGSHTLHLVIPVFRQTRYANSQILLYARLPAWHPACPYFKTGYLVNSQAVSFFILVTIPWPEVLLVGDVWELKFLQVPETVYRFCEFSSRASIIDGLFQGDSI